MNNQIPIIIVKNVQRLMSDPEHLILVIGTTKVEKKWVNIIQKIVMVIQWLN